MIINEETNSPSKDVGEVLIPAGAGSNVTELVEVACINGMIKVQATSQDYRLSATKPDVD